MIRRNHRPLPPGPPAGPEPGSRRAGAAARSGTAGDARTRIAAVATLALAALAALAAVAVLTLAGGCARTGPQGGESLVLIPAEQEVRIGSQVAENVRQQFTVLDDAEVQDYVDRIGRSLAAHQRREGIEYEFTVLDTSMVNAFAAPGGWIYVTTGLLKMVETEAQLAGVLAHEIGHVVGRHSVQQLQEQYGAQLASRLLLDDAETLQKIAGIATNLMLLEHSRDQELASDEFAIEYTLAENYDPRGIIRFFEKLMAEREGEPAGGVAAWFRTHPTTEQRIEQVRELLGTEYHPDYDRLQVNRERYQRLQARLG